MGANDVTGDRAPSEKLDDENIVFSFKNLF